MQEMNIFSPNGQQYEIVDKKARENIAQNAQNITTKADKTYVEEELLKKADNTSLDAKLDKEPIPMALPADTQEVRRKEDGSLWTKPSGGGSGGGGAVDSVNGQTGNVILSLADLNGDELHRTVTDREKEDWIVKSSVGKATPDDTQEVHVTPDGKLVTAPSGGGISPEIVVTTDPNATVTATSGLKVVTGNTGDDGKCSLKIPSFGVWEVSAQKEQQKSNTVSVTIDSVKQYEVTLTFFSATIVVTTDNGATVTATLGDTVLTEESTGKVTFTVYEKGLWKLKAEKDSQTAETTINVTDSVEYKVNLEIVAIYGVQWDGTANTKWSRTDNAVEFVDPNPAINNGTGSSPFDNIMPWAGMVRSNDPQAGEVVAIPKFYYKWTAVGNGLKLQISMEKPDETYFVSPAHMDREDGKGERDVVYLGRFHCASNWKSATGVNPKNTITRSDARQNIHNLGANVWQWDWHMHMTIWMLYLVEFADWNCQAAIGYGCGRNSGVEHMGKSDAMKYHTGTPYSSRRTYGVGVQYRYIEGLWDNVYDWVDGCYYNNSGLNIINDPSQFRDTKNGTPVGIPTSNFPSKFAVKEVNNFQAIYPIASDGSDSTYACDNWGFNASDPCLVLGGFYYNNLNYGIDCIYHYSVSGSYDAIGTRLQVLP